MQELLGQSHPAYRQIVTANSRKLIDVGLKPVETLADSLLVLDGRPRLFRDGLLLGELRPPAAARAGIAGLSVSHEAKQAMTMLEGGRKAEREAAAALRPLAGQPAQQAVVQQVGSIVREERAMVEEGALLLTPDGRLYELVPLPSHLRQHALARPNLMPAAQVAALRSRAMRDLEPALASGYLDRVVEIVTPFSSNQIGRFAGQIMGKLAGASNLVP